MTNQIEVSVVEFSDRKFYMMQWVDPATKLKKTRSTKVERTGRKSDRTEAERVAAKHEAELRSGRYRLTSNMDWADFTDRYETEVGATLAESTGDKIRTTFALVERILRPNKLRDVTPEAISRWIGELEREGRSVATVCIYCRHLKAALNWAADLKFITEAPKFRVPRAPKGDRLMKGRPIVLEEHERMLAVVPKVIGEAHAAAWRHFLEGLWWSGLRLSEAVRLSWDPSEPISVVMQPGYRPILKFQAAGQKARRAELVPITPEFAEMLEAVPESARVGRVFDLQARQNHDGPMTIEQVSRLVSRIGKAAGVIVDEKTGKPASAHDYRRAFGTRWAKRVRTPTLRRLMRHRDIKTTLTYYVEEDAEQLSAELWASYGQASNTFGNTSAKKQILEP